MIGKTIQIYLPDGNPKSVKKASITTDKVEIYYLAPINTAILDMVNTRKKVCYSIKVQSAKKIYIKALIILPKEMNS